MKKIKTVGKWLLLVVAVLFIIAQFKRPEKTNPASDTNLSLEAQAHPDHTVTAIFERSCVDCHSNRTRWPWYSNVAPVSWFVIDHVNEGRSQLNLSEWGKYDQRRKGRKLEEICEMVEGGDMPLSSYTPLHPGSKLTAQDVQVLCDWTKTERALLSATK